jgi:cytochrome P450
MALRSFVMAMIAHPEVQRKAHIILDDVIGSDRLPDVSDRTLLPYIEAIMMETFRWRPVTPLGEHFLQLFLGSKY